MSTQSERLSQFRALHGPGKMLVLPNAWDAASARMAQELGAGAIATSSAAVAWCHGYSDREYMPTAVALEAARELIRVVNTPVSVDSEAGYSDDPAKAASHVLSLIDAGVAGINLEDGTSPPELLVGKIRAIKEAAKANGADIFINARCDVYLQNLAPDERKLEESLRRGKLYAEAGADGLFMPAMNALPDIRAVIGAIDLPLNILIMRAAPSLAELKAAGVRRVSAGALIGRAAYGQAHNAIKMLLSQEKYDAIFATSADCPDFNALFA
ncbi:MAG TPA: isocitrate lyase/phosphoenolpyruvate mutase family protein [Rhizomicrobium sp.]|nr:isocitrate lyase/phosphoenolpyruvate mutase family protein [Rhizomicrobium sp.]